MFKKAIRNRVKLRLAIEGPSGSGKTYSALRIARGLVGDRGKIAVIDTENNSASLYSDLTDFDVCTLEPPFRPERYVEAIHAAEAAGYDVLVIDSTSHEWVAAGGCLEINDAAGGNKFNNWTKTKSRHQQFIDAIVFSPIHIIATIRSKEKYEQANNDKGKPVIEKLGEAPEQQKGIAYEFTAVLTMDVKKHTATSSKDRTGLFGGPDAFLPTEQTGRDLLTWANSGDGIDIPVLKVACSQCTTRAELAAYFASRKDEITAAPNAKDAYQVFNWHKSQLPEDKPATPPQADEPPTDEPIGPATAAFIAQDAARGEQSHA